MKHALLWTMGVALAAATLFGTTVSAQESERHRDSSGRECGSRYNSWWSWSGRLQVVGLTEDQRLICFRENAPYNAKEIGSIRGLQGDEKLVGIDFRPATGVLYGLGDQGGIYSLDTRTAEANLQSTLNMDLDGTAFGVDFNPAVDRLRIVSNTGQNLRTNVDDGTTIVDSALNYPAPGANPAPGITGAAYTNNDSDPNTATTLYNIDTMLDQVNIQAPANAGTLSPTGKLLVDTNTAVGFDIYSTVRNGSTVDIQAFATLTVDGQARFYKITLFTGQASNRGAFGAANQVIGIAIPLNQL